MWTLLAEIFRFPNLSPSILISPFWAMREGKEKVWFVRSSCTGVFGHSKIFKIRRMHQPKLVKHNLARKISAYTLSHFWNLIWPGNWPIFTCRHTKYQKYPVLWSLSFFRSKQLQNHGSCSTQSLEYQWTIRVPQKFTQILGIKSTVQKD